MGAKRKHRRKEAHADLVPVKGDRIAAALRSTGISFREANRTILGKDESDPALSLLANGRQSAWRLDLIKRVARLTRVPLPWLTGEWDRLPEVGGVGGGWLADAQLELFRLIQDSLVAALHDLRRELQKKSRKVVNLEQALQSEQWPAIHAAVVRAVRELVEPEHWQVQLMGWKWVGRPAQSPGDDPAALLGLIKAWRAILLPWHKNERPLNYVALRRLRTRPPDFPGGPLRPNTDEQTEVELARDLPEASPMRLLDPR